MMLDSATARRALLPASLPPVAGQSRFESVSLMLVANKTAVRAQLVLQPNTDFYWLWCFEKYQHRICERTDPKESGSLHYRVNSGIWLTGIYLSSEEHQVNTVGVTHFFRQYRGVYGFATQARLSFQLVAAIASVARFQVSFVSWLL